VLAGSAKMRKKFLPGIASGEIIPAFALTEPEAGSDAGELQTKAIREGEHYRISLKSPFRSNTILIKARFPHQNPYPSTLAFTLPG